MSGFKMTCWARLRMVTLAISLLLLLTVQASSSTANRSSSSSSSSSSSTAGRSPRCISQEMVEYRLLKHARRWHMDTRSVSNDTRTCAETAKQMYLSDRALSPWKYRLDKDENRFPSVIIFAECLCQGCIINQHENMSYNSVPVHTSWMVKIRTQCPTYPDKYLVKWNVIQVPVACVCVVPK